MMKKKFLFIGAINKNKPAQGGEEFKNQLILSKLKLESIKLTSIDTINWKKSPAVIFLLFYNLIFINFDSIIISASSVSSYRLLRIIAFIPKKILSKTSYIVVGGYFPEAIKNNIFRVDIYDKLKCIILQGESFKNTLQDFLFKVSIHVVPNFKNFPIIVDVTLPDTNYFHFVFVGRLLRAKGVACIIEASKLIKKQFPNLNFTVDFFGPLEECFKFDHICRYQGYLDFTLDAEKSYYKLNSYNCFLFPTTWKGEGFPGVVIDAYAACLPVIATDWNMNKEIICDGENGFIIPPNDVQALAKKMIWVINNRDLCNKIGMNNQKVSKQYHIDIVWNKLFDLLK